MQLVVEWTAHGFIWVVVVEVVCIFVFIAFHSEGSCRSDASCQLRFGFCLFILCQMCFGFVWGLFNLSLLVVNINGSCWVTFLKFIPIFCPLNLCILWAQTCCSRNEHSNNKYMDGLNIFALNVDHHLDHTVCFYIPVIFSLAQILQLIHLCLCVIMENSNSCDSAEKKKLGCINIWINSQCHQQLLTLYPESSSHAEIIECIVSHTQYMWSNSSEL